MALKSPLLSVLISIPLSRYETIHIVLYFTSFKSILGSSFETYILILASAVTILTMGCFESREALDTERHYRNMAETRATQAERRATYAESRAVNAEHRLAYTTGYLHGVVDSYSGQFRIGYSQSSSEGRFIEYEN